jgi:hypothetical protein
MRTRIATVLLSISTILTGLAALYWRDRTTWYSQDEIDAWAVRARIDLGLADDEVSPRGEARMLVCRHATPPDPAYPYFVHVLVVGPCPDGPFRDVHEAEVWTVSHRNAIDVANDVADELLVDANLAALRDDPDFDPDF